MTKLALIAAFLVGVAVGHITTTFYEREVVLRQLGERHAIQ